MDIILDETKGLLENQRKCRLGVHSRGPTYYGSQETQIKSGYAGYHRTLQFAETQEDHWT